MYIVKITKNLNQAKYCYFLIFKSISTILFQSKIWELQNLVLGFFDHCISHVDTLVFELFSKAHIWKEIVKWLSQILNEGLDVSVSLGLYHSIPRSALQAATILVAMASGKNFWRPKFWQKSGDGDHFTVKDRHKATFWKSELGALPILLISISWIPTIKNLTDTVYTYVAFPKQNTWIPHIFWLLASRRERGQPKSLETI